MCLRKPGLTRNWCMAIAPVRFEVDGDLSEDQRCYMLSAFVCRTPKVFSVDKLKEIENALEKLGWKRQKRWICSISM
jgi:hypothetical protein